MKVTGSLLKHLTRIIPRLSQCFMLATLVLILSLSVEHTAFATRKGLADPRARSTRPVTIESVQRALQKRYEKLLGTASMIQWIPKPGDSSAPAYPDNYYQDSLNDPAFAARLVRQIVTNLNNNTLLVKFAYLPNGFSENMDQVLDMASTQVPKPPVSTTGSATSVTEQNFSLKLEELEGYLTRHASHVIVSAQQVNKYYKQVDYGSPIILPKTYPEENEGPIADQGDKLLESPEFPIPLSDGEKSVRIGHAPTPVAHDKGRLGGDGLGGIETSARIDGLGTDCLPKFEPLAYVPSSAIQVSGNTMKVLLRWWSCDDIGGGYELTLHWALSLDCSKLAQAIYAKWGAAPQESTSTGIRAWEEAQYSSGNTSRRYKRVKGQLSADLTKYTEAVSGMCFIKTSPIGSGNDHNAPCPSDGRWHFFQNVSVGGVWTSSEIGDVFPHLILACPQSDSLTTAGWSLAGNQIILEMDYSEGLSGGGGGGGGDGDEDCEECDGGDCAPGLENSTAAGFSSQGDIRFTTKLGNSAPDKVAGRLTIVEGKPSKLLGTPKNLRYAVSKDTEVVRATDFTVKQIKTAQVFVNVVVITENKYQIDYYLASQSGTKDANGYYQPIGNPYTTTTVENVLPDNNYWLRIQQSYQGTINTTDYKWNSEVIGWELSRQNLPQKELRYSTWDGAKRYRTETRLIKDQTGKIVSKQTYKYERFVWGESLIKKVVDPDGAAQTTLWFYYDSVSTSNPNYGHLKEVVYPSGYWERYEYTNSTSLSKVVCQYLDSAVGSAESSNKVITYTYSTSDPAVTVIETIQGQEVSREYTEYNPNEARNIVVQKVGDPWTASTNLVTSTKFYGNGDFIGDIKSRKNPDGTMDLYEYSLGNNLKTTTVYSGAPNGAETAITNGIKTITVLNLVGTVLTNQIFDIATNLKIDETHVTQLDGFGRALQVRYLDGTTHTKVYGCCGLNSETDREGITTSYTYDEFGRLKASSRADITSLHTYDVLGQTLTTSRKGSDGSVIVQSRSAYDMAGRLISSSNALGYVTTYSYSSNGLGQSIHTTTYPDGSTQVDTTHQDGKSFSITGTAVHPVKYQYGTHSLGGEFTKQIKVGSNNEETEWVKSYTDIAGRTFKTEYADGATETSEFNGIGQLVKQKDPDNVTTLLSYNAMGRQEIMAIDMNQNGTIDFSGTDRITRTQRSVASARGTTVHQTETAVWDVDNQNTSRTVSIQETSVDGLKSWSTINGLTSISEAVYLGSGIRSLLATAADGSFVTNRFVNGKSVLEKRYYVTGEGTTVLSSTTSTYDTHGRVASRVNVRNGTTLYTYTLEDQLETLTSPASGDGSAPQVTAYRYDSRGRPVSVMHPDGAIVNTEYFTTDEIKKTYGARTYPVEYTYDSQGRMKTMKTWQDFEGNSGMATTAWNYDSQRGWLTSKLYHDGNGTSYTYKPSGRLHIRTWDREITTTYSYNNAGEMSGINYSDTTPDVTYTFNRLGQVISVTDGIGTHTIDYNVAGQIATNSIGAFVVSQEYDSLLRRNDLKLNISGSQVFDHAFTYDGASRLLTATADGTNSVTYSYLANSSLVGTLNHKRNTTSVMTTTKQYDYLNRLTSIASVANGTTVSSYSYLYNQANQRTKATLADNSYWNYAYDELGQVTSGKKYFSDGVSVAGKQHEYAYDDIGNRLTERKGGNFQGSGLSSSGYMASLLNQYTNRTVPGVVDVYGTASQAATVTVNERQVEWKGSYFHQKIGTNNTANPVYLNVKTVAATNNVGPNQLDVVTEVAGDKYLAQTPELFSYDTDGNLTQDGRWNYTWDGENRLVAMETISSVPAAAKKKLEFEYDYVSRRSLKKVYAWNSGSGIWNLEYSTRFIYDGWNLIAEVNASNNTAIRTYLWGLDLSGSLQGAGGVGGLLAIDDEVSVNCHFISYDGNGNVTASIKVSEALLTAEYEFGPLGEVLKAIGSYAQSNPFRFSTKFQDEESGLNYYGYRFYSANLGRWINRDPIEEIGGLNLYCFIKNDAVKYFDKLGLWKEVVGFNDAEKVLKIKNAEKLASKRLAEVDDIMPEYGITRLQEKYPNLFRVTDIGRKEGYDPVKFHTKFHTKVAGNIRKMKEVIAANTTTAACGDPKRCVELNADAYTTKGGDTIWFCPGFFDGTPNDAAGGVIHEYSHLAAYTIDDLEGEYDNGNWTLNWEHRWHHAHFYDAFGNEPEKVFEEYFKTLEDTAHTLGYIEK